MASGLIYLNSHASDFKNRDPSVSDRYLRGSNGYKAEERVNLLKLLWDCMATEFGGRHELYEINYGGSTEEIAASACSARRPPAMPTASRASSRSAWPNTTSTAERCRTSPILAN